MRQQRWTTRNLGLLAMTVSLPLLVYWFWPQAFRALVREWERRYELQQDSRGRLVRLDTKTGEMMIVEGTKLIPIIPVTPLPAAARTGGTSRPSPAATLIANPGAPAEIPATEAELTTLPAGQMATIANATPVFVTPNDHQTPLKTFAAGTKVKIHAVQGDWYQIEFDDPRWGERFGFVPRKAVEAIASDDRD